MTFLKLLAIYVAATVVCSPILAQTNPDEQQGLRPYDSFHGGDLDSTSLTNGGLTLHIPLASFPQRGNLELSFMVRFSSKQWRVYIPPAPHAQPFWGPAPNSGTQIVSSVDWWTEAFSSLPDDMGNITWTQSVVSPDGASHFMGGRIDGTGTPVFPLRSRDATGLLQTDANTVMMPDGRRFSYSNGNVIQQPNHIQDTQPSSVTDVNGNQITIGTNGWTDTMGRLIPGSSAGVGSPMQPGVPTSDLSKCPSGTTSAQVWNIPGVATVNNGIRTFYFCYSPVAIAPTFGNSSPVYQATWSMLTAVVLPDLTMWTFAYDAYGDVTRLGLPTGGSISYTYEIGPTNCSNVGGPHNSMWVQSRAVDANDGTGGHTWQYRYTAPATGNYASGGTATVTSPDGNDAVHTMGEAASVCPGYDVQTQYFQGSSSSNVLLKTTQTQFAGNLITDAGSRTAANVVPLQVTTALPGGQAAKVVNSWDPTTTDILGDPVMTGSLIEKDEYDFSNSLARSTLNHYLWQDNSSYLNANMIRLLSWSTVYNGAPPQTTGLPACSSSSTPACIAQVKYGYDGSAVAASGVTTHLLAPPAGGNIRGNLTTTSRWLDTAGSFLSSVATYFDTGMRANSTPPANADGLNRTTTYTYAPAFQGAYLTQTNMPDTTMPDTGATVVHHIISGSYDFNTGLLTSFTDENGQQFTYTYDNMLRLTQGNHPDGGVTKFNYPDPNTVERQRLITGSTYDDFKVKFDGLGRAIQTQQLTPDCPSYIKVDTGYDSQGRTASVSNPYCLTNEPTYGITQTLYDGLSRVSKTIKQDGSFSAAQYNTAAADGAGSSVVCTTTIDESGRPRQACVDGLGRLAKVIETNPATAATNPIGWVTISGSEQNAITHPATSASVTVTIGGTDATDKTCVRTCTSYPDTGTMQFTVVAAGVTVGPVAVSGGYGGSSTPASLAAALYSAFPANSVVTMSNPNGGASFTLTTIATGSSTNSSTISTQIASNCTITNTTACGKQGWTMTLSGPNLAPTTASSANFSGGQDAATVSDTGTVSIAINGSAYSTSYGAGDNPSSIAARLATAINAGQWANASANGGTVNLTGKSGTEPTYSLSASYTWNTSQFASPSFTTSTSGSALNPAFLLTNSPYVTTYQYNARGDMLCVHQKATDTSPDVACTGTTAPSVPAAWRQRFFTYDSFSRVLTAMNPETNTTGSTTITYNYDADGNLISKLEPAPNQAWGSSATVTIGYSYDALNRLLDTTYSDGTTAKTSHRYDYSSFLGQRFAYPIGREVAATSANNTIESFTSYDPVGRVASTVQCNPGVTGCKTFTATYDKLGDLTTLAYPGNGFTVTYGYDAAARLTSATDSSGVVYAQSPAFWASGAIKEFTAPNFNNNKYHVDLNNRLQPTEIWTGSAQGSSALFDKQYQYNAPNTSQVNNGNIYTVTNVVDNTRTQTFAYDALNRLISAGDQTHWSNTYTYDPWGNLYRKDPGSLPGEGLAKTADSYNHLSGIGYDAAGNEISDGSGGTFVYDAENRITTTAGVTYAYDADGRRIQKSTGVNYWYGPSGAALAETDSGGNWTYYIFFGGQRLARNISGDIKYYITDHLHSTAMFVDKAGTQAAVLDDNDFYPWGGVVPGVGKTASNNTVKFTGQYRDTESQLDYFGARYYANINGRFMSPDWAAKPTSVPYAEFGDPQSLNLYSYVRNSPIVRVDAHGHGFNWYPGADVRSDGYLCETCGINRDGTDPGSTDVNGRPYYTQTVVSGATANEAANNANEGRNIGTTLFYSYDYEYTTDVTGTTGNFVATSSVTSVTVTATITVNTAVWSGYEKASAADKAAWDKAAATVKQHEEGHVRIDQQGIKLMEQAIRGASGTARAATKPEARASSLQALDKAIQASSNGAIEAVHINNQLYDIITGHGLLQNITPTVTLAPQ